MLRGINQSYNLLTPYHLYIISDFIIGYITSIQFQKNDIDISEKWKKQTSIMHNANNTDESGNKICSEARRNTFRKSNKVGTNSTPKKYVTTVKSSKNGEVLQTVVKLVKGNNRRNTVFTCSFTGCQFSSVYSKDLTRHIRKHTGKAYWQTSK